MKQVIIKKGGAEVEETAAPQIEPGTILVAVKHSCISIGTEMSSVNNSAMPLWKRALKEPENLKKAIDMVKSQGLAKTRSFVQGKVEGGNASGYSAAGVVLQVGEGITDLKVGDRVACAGAQCAHHASVIRVPRNLSVKIPDGVKTSDASTVTLGAIALQGVRRLEPTLGESFVVLGLGVLGQLTVQFLKANGCRVIGLDLDASRIKKAEELGMDVGIGVEEGSSIEQVSRLTDGFGADGVIITAASPSDEIISQAFLMCRRKGRVVLVGDVGLNLNRSDFYAKEIDFRISTSYGPGRYDARYEEEGLDYPIGYVRWTENRNLREYLRLMADGQVKVAPLVEAVFPIEKASEAYASLKKEGQKPLLVLLKYEEAIQLEKLERKIPNPLATPLKKGPIQIALVGAGGFAKGMHLPNFQSLKDDFQIRAIVSRTGHNAQATAAQFEAAYSTTEFEKVIADPDIDLVVICTRHDRHAELSLKALKAGKNVLVEKPLALTEPELKSYVEFYEGDQTEGKPLLLTGFNRRFSPALAEITKLTEKRTAPMVINYQMNAGYIALDHWVHGDEGGGRNRGEACHIYDLFTYLTGSRVVKVQAQSLGVPEGHYSSSDNFVVNLSFADGSLAHLTYVALGSKASPKEQMNIYFDGKVISLKDYQGLEFYGCKGSKVASATPQKGQLEEIKALSKALKEGGDWPIPLWQQLQATEISFEVEKQIHSTHPQKG